MPLPSPNLDDRNFSELIEEVKRIAQQNTPQWTDLSPSDPGMVLLELFAYLTETMLKRLNKLPELAYIEFLRLIGVRLHPPAAASVILRFKRSRPIDRPTEIPRGTRVTVGISDASREKPTFITTRSVSISARELEAETLAYHCDVIEAELAGTGTGQPGLVVVAAHAPIIAPTGDSLDLLVGVETTQEETDANTPVIRYDTKIYRIWREVNNFTNLGSERFVYVADRMSGIISFAPAAHMEKEDGRLGISPEALGEIVPSGREIRLWYRHGGGPEGNVAANTLTALRDTIPGVEVTNPQPATGGQETETLENALIRGPQELHSLHRAVTARDFELTALNSSQAIVRVKSVTRAALWRHAIPGTVEILLVPNLPENQQEDGRVPAEKLLELETEVPRTQILEALNERRPLGTTCIVNWAHYKTVRAEMRIVVRRESDNTTLRQRVLYRLNQTINPLPTKLNPSGWSFGQALHASHIYDIALQEPDVLWVDRVKLMVQDVPETDVTSITVDSYQPRTWYACSGLKLFRSLNNGEGWEPVRDFGQENTQLVCAHPDKPGLLAVLTKLPESSGSRVHVSSNCGETWEESQAYITDFEIEDLAWMSRGADAVLLMATDVGLYELTILPNMSPVHVLVDPSDQNRGFYSVIASTDIRGQTCVAVASQSQGGVFISSEGGRSLSFRHIGLQGEDVRVLAVQFDGPRSFMWAGVAAAGSSDTGKGCFRWELRGSEDPPEGWVPFSEGWAGGSCRSIAFAGNNVLAASYGNGVLKLRTNELTPKWETPDVRCGLPLRDRGRFQPVGTIATETINNLVMAGGAEGIFRAEEPYDNYFLSSTREFTDKVTLPATWLFCSGNHEITVVNEDEAE